MPSLPILYWIHQDGPQITITCHTKHGCIREHFLSYQGNRNRTADLMQGVEIIHRSREIKEMINPYV